MIFIEFMESKNYQYINLDVNFNDIGWNKKESWLSMHMLINFFFH